MAMYGDYISLDTPTRNADQRNYALGLYYRNATPAAGAGSLAEVSSARSRAPTTAPTIAGHTTGTTTDFAHTRRLFAPPSSSPEPSSTFTSSKASRKLDRAPSNASKSTRLRHARFPRCSILSTDNTPVTRRCVRASLAGSPHSDDHLERNRIAASKCRQRKKELVGGLEKAKKRLETQNLQLQTEHNRLLGEVNYMKNQIMAHANCHDTRIDKWIEKEARRFTAAPEGTNDFGYGRLPDAGVPPFLIDFQFSEQVLVPETLPPGGEPSQNLILDGTLLAADIAAETNDTVQPNSSTTYNVEARV